MRAAETLRREGFDGSLRIIGAEEHFPPFDRPPLSKQVLTDKWEPEKSRLRVGDLDAELMLGATVTRVDIGSRQLIVGGGGGGGGRAVDFDGLVIATGASPRTVPSVEALERVQTLRTIDDCLTLRRRFEDGGRVVVIGAGFIGSEVASSALERGLEVTVVEALEVPLLRVLGRELGGFCAQLQREAGVDLRLDVGLDHIEGNGSDSAMRVHLTDGAAVDAATVVVGIGVVPNVAWLTGTDLMIADGVVCDSRCRVLGSDGQPVPDIVAAGDVARWHNPLFDATMRIEHWTNATEGGEASARALLHGDDAPPYAPVPYFWSDQFAAKLQYIGHSQPSDELRIVEGDMASGRLVAAWGREGRTVAALCINRPNRTIPFRNAIAAAAPYPPEVA